MILRFLQISWALLFAVAVAACGVNESDIAASSAPKSELTGASSATTPMREAAGKSAFAALDLASAPIDRALFLGLEKPPMVPVGPCPFLTDATALGTARRSAELVRRSVSNEECRWSKNLGFSVEVKVEPLANAKALKDRAYNMDSPPVFEALLGPGSNALILKDTVWDEKGRPYAIGFELDDRLVTIFVTGLATESSRLIATANEVAARLTTAPNIEKQFGQPERFDVCTTWPVATMSALAGMPLTAEQQADSCTWKAGDGWISLGVFSGRNFPFDSLIADRGAREIPDLGMRATVFRQNRKPASILDVTLGDDMMINISVSETVSGSDEVALALARNVISRF